jgi:hypothetical protein
MRLRSSFSRRAFARHFARALCAAALVGLTGGCVSWSGPDGDDDAFSLSRRAWEESRPSAYTYTLQRTCGGCSAERRRPVVITVRDGAVTERRYASDGAAVPAGEAAFFPTIDGLFDELRQLLTIDTTARQVAFDGSRGYPRSVLIDPSPSRGEDEEGWQITTFQTVP